MRESNDCGSKCEERSSALWGSGGRGGERRSSALWGKGGKGKVLTTIAVLALSAPIAASANPNSAGGNGNDRDATYVQSELTQKAKNDPNAMVHVIVTSNYGGADAQTKAKALGNVAKLGKKLDLVGGIALEVPA